MLVPRLPFTAFMAMMAAKRHDNACPNDSTPAIVHDFVGSEFDLTENHYNIYNRAYNCPNGETRSVEYGFGQGYFWVDYQSRHPDGKCWLFSVDSHDPPRAWDVDLC